MALYHDLCPFISNWNCMPDCPKTLLLGLHPLMITFFCDKCFGMTDMSEDNSKQKGWSFECCHSHQPVNLFPWPECSVHSLSHRQVAWHFTSQNAPWYMVVYHVISDPVHEICKSYKLLHDSVKEVLHFYNFRATVTADNTIKWSTTQPVNET
jgi:hypothetical protein